MTDDTNFDNIIGVIKHYAHSPSGIVAVLSENVCGLVLVAKWVPARKAGHRAAMCGADQIRARNNP